MHFATPRNLIAMALAWALFLVAYDQHANPRPLATYWAEFKGSSTRPTVVSEGDTPRVRLSFPHLCCTGCLNDVRAALKPLAWLAPARLATEPPPIEEVEATAPDAMTAHEIEFDILDPTQANFVLLQQALRDTGLVPDRIEVFGMGHFRLEVELPHLCCTVCSRAVDEQLKRLLRKETQGRWLDSVVMNHVKKTVTIYARLNAVVDVVELTRALEQAGFAAHAIRVVTGPES
jgi:copper chaperone CopZ